MASNDTHTEFRTALEIIQSDEDVTTQFCLVCTEIFGRQYWSRHVEHDDGSHECLTCRERQVPRDEQATDADVRDAIEEREGDLV